MTDSEGNEIEINDKLVSSQCPGGPPITVCGIEGDVAVLRGRAWADHADSWRLNQASMLASKWVLASKVKVTK